MYVVVGYGAEQVKEKFADAPDVVWVKQEERKGTAHAILCCEEYLGDFEGQTLVLCGDGPLIRAETLNTLTEKHLAEKSAVTLATAVLEDPSGYGRIVRDAYGNMQGIVEHSDCTEEQLAINEVNPSYYLFDNKVLFEAAHQVKPNNVKKELYLTDAVAIVLATGKKVIAVTAVRPEEALSINSRHQLSETSKIMQVRIQRRLMDSGVTIVDPDNTWIDIRAEIGQDTQIEPFTYIHGTAKIGRGCRIGPFAYLRDGTIIEDDVVLGVFTEVKNASLGSGVRARHLSYIADAKIGKRVQIGAGAVTANFDGHEVSRTEIGDDSYVASGAIMVAPLVLGPNSYVKAGKVITQMDLEK
jgi:bifunctional UDP-N-acetylglucosamine pyrophosphorylase/glucosamine-1-phosphate N-acetyltransferase